MSDVVASESTRSESLAARYLECPISDDLRLAMRDGLERLGLSDALLAVRSSGLEEDSTEHSFAGQFESFLYQRGEEQVLDALRRCWASAGSARIAAYRRAAGMDGVPARMGVVIQRMVDSEAAGVAFSRDPLRPAERSTVVIESVWGQGEGLVGGTLDADRFEVNRDTLAVSTTIASKTDALLQDPAGGTRAVALDDTRRQQPSLTDEQAREVARMAVRLETDFGAPQDAEWAFADGVLWILQTRPITTLPPQALFDPHVNGSQPVIWDNSNIIESFAGVTTPLTFTHVSRCYREVYLQFCRFMRVPDDVIDAHEPMFRNMLGLIRGRVYYNLLNWYQLLSLFPGAPRNKGFMETMMGVQQSLTPELAALFEPLQREQAPSRGRYVAMIVHALYRFARVQRDIEAFMGNIARVYGPLERADLHVLSLAEQIALYRRLEEEVLKRWTAPIVSDTRCMVAFGLLKDLTARWVATASTTVPDDAGALQNDLLCGEGDMKSTEPTRLLMRIAERVDQGDPNVRERFLAEPPERAWGSLQSGFAPELRAMFDDFLERYGFRCADELKLEEPDLHDDPRFIITSVQSYVRLGRYSVAEMEARESQIRSGAEARVLDALTGIRRWVFFRVLGWARTAVRDRELLRFERTRTFGITRRLFRGMGANLTKLGVLDDEQDVFYLTLDELMAFHEGRFVGDCRTLVALRRREFDEYRRTPPPPDRFVTHGAAGAAARYPLLLIANDLQQEPEADADPNVLRGTACSPGIVEGIIRVALRLEDTEGMQGEILVTERTDPGWVPVFPSCGGLIIERGSLLSHSAVVARELGIPTIVGVAGHPTRRLKSGQRVRMDAGKGEVRIL
jgi:phosphohistidine swiveling domain-containing protein